MDEEKYLVLDKDGQDVTGDVTFATPHGDRTEIVFSKTGKKFFYSMKNISIKSNPKIVETDVAINGRVVLWVERKLLFDNFLKLFFKGRKKNELHRGDFQILQSRIAGALEYFYNVAQQVKNLPSEGPTTPENTLVADTISNMSDVPLDSPLFLYLSGTIQTSTSVDNLIFPFQCNESQLTAVEQTFSNRLSLIQGPPGTGKTQTILNILINALMENKRVAVVSNNNSAIQNVVDKLSVDGLNFMAALLGNTKNQEAFIKNQPGYPQWLCEHSDPPSDPEIQLQELKREIKQLFAEQNTLKKKQAEMDAWNIEATKFAECYPDTLQLQDNDLSSTI